MFIAKEVITAEAEGETSRKSSQKNKPSQQRPEKEKRGKGIKKEDLLKENQGSK